MEQYYEIAQSLVARKVAGELLLVPVRDNQGDLSIMYTANETGTRIWDLITQKLSLTQIIQTLLEEYEIVDKQSVENDVKNFLEQLTSIGVLQ